MKEMPEQDRQDKDAARARWKRIAEKVIRVFGLAGGVFWLLLFIGISSTGYISWIGIAVGVSIIGPFVLSSVAGVAGSRRLEKRLARLSQITVILIVVAVVAAFLWPEGKGTWRPYTFKDELAAIEAKRAIPDADNAARHYDSALADVDVNDRPDFIFSGVSIRDEFGRRPWRGEDFPEVAHWLDSHGQTVHKLLPIREIKECRWPIYSDDNGSFTVPYKKLRHAAELLVLAGNRDFGEGRLREALDKYFCVLRNADHLYQQTHSLDFRYGLHHERDALLMIRQALIAGELSGADIEEVAHWLPTATDTWHQDVARLLEYDELRFAQIMASAYEVNEQGRIRFAASARCLFQNGQAREDSALKGRVWRLYWLMNMPLKPEGVWDMAAGESGTLAKFLQPGPMLPAARSDFDSFWRFLGWAGKTLLNLTRWYAHEACFSEFLSASFGEDYAEEMSHRRGTWLVLGLRRYHDANGVWPQTLEMIAKYVPAEAFVDPTAGGAFVYALDGDGFKLYSRGANRVDDSGRHRYVKALDRLEDDISMWPPPPPPEPRDEESIREELEAIYGKEYVEAHFKDKGSDKK